MTHSPSTSIEVGDRRIGLTSPVYFIAEIGSNFDGDLDRARDLIGLAKEAGADAAKFQHYTAGSLVSDHGFHQLGANTSHQSAWKKSVFDTYEHASLNRDWTQALSQGCQDEGIDFLTSPYSPDLVDYVEPFVPAFKIGSGDITWTEIISHIAAKGKPVLLATGASTTDDVKRAANAVLDVNPDLVLMQCNTNYTADLENYACLELGVLTTYALLYPGVVLGLSDHMPGHVSVLGAVALGARVIEKHFTDSTDRRGPDHSFSMTPASWREMVDRTRELEAALGRGIKKIEANERATAIVQRRCVRASRHLAAGTVLTTKDFTMLRPCPEDAIPPHEARELVGRKINRDLSDGEYLRREDLS